MADKTLRLEIRVDDKGTPVIKEFASGVRSAADTMESKGSASAKKLSEGLGNVNSTMASIIKSGVGFTGFQGVAAIATNAFQAMKSFDSELANVNTLLDGGAVSIEQLRAQIIKLPPELGSSTELAKGLYQALSAGVEPAKAVAFVGDAAKLAKAGLTETDTAVKVLTATMDAYGKGAEDPGHVSDVLFTAVKLGKMTMGELASSIGTVLPIAATMGVSFEEVTATVTTLTKVFPSTSEAVTGLRSAFSAMLQNADKFKAAGIDIKAVIAEKGVTGAMEALKIATGGSAEKVQKLIPDVQGLTAVLGLMGAQFEAQKKNVDAMTTALGATDEAAKKVQSSFQAASDRLANSWDRLVQQAGPAVFDILGVLADAAEKTFNVTKLNEHTLALGQTTERMKDLATLETEVAAATAKRAALLDGLNTTLSTELASVKDIRAALDALNGVETHATATTAAHDAAK